MNEHMGPPGPPLKHLYIYLEAVSEAVKPISSGSLKLRQMHL